MNPEQMETNNSVNSAERTPEYIGREELITEARNFSGLYARIGEVQKEDPDFCPAPMLDYIRMLESVDLPVLAAQSSNVMKAITGKYDLRGTVSRLLNALPAKPASSSVNMRGFGEQDENRAEVHDGDSAEGSESASPEEGK